MLGVVATSDPWPLFMQVVVACSYNPASLEAEFWNSMDSTPVGCNSASTVGWIVQPPVIHHKESNLTKYWDITETRQQTEIAIWA